MTALSAHTGSLPKRNSAIDQVDVGRDFSKTTGGRYRKLGPFSGEQFRQEWLVPKMKSAIETGERFRVRIDTVSRSYQPSFLDEAFAGLVRDEGFSKPDVQRLLVIVSDEPRFQKYKALAESYINSVN